MDQSYSADSLRSSKGSVAHPRADDMQPVAQIYVIPRDTDQSATFDVAKGVPRKPLIRLAPILPPLAREMGYLGPVRVEIGDAVGQGECRGSNGSNCPLP